MSGYKLLFVLGAPKSGTTWLQHILNQHPSVICNGEGAFHKFGIALNGAVKEYNTRLSDKSDIFGETAFPPLNKAEFRALFRCFVLERLRRSADKKKSKQLVWVGEKDPDHAAYPEIMVDAFPDATFVHIIRDGRDHAVSMWHHVHRLSRIKENNPDGSILGGYAAEKVLEDFGGFDGMVLKTAQKWSNTIRHVRRVTKRAGANYYETRYEAFIDDPEKAALSLFKFLDISRSPSVIAQCIEKSDFSEMSGGRMSGHEDRSSFFRKGVKGDWRNHIDDELSRAFIRETKGLMEELGYR